MVKKPGVLLAAAVAAAVAAPIYFMSMAGVSIK
jgi:hypothetical protein